MLSHRIRDREYHINLPNISMVECTVLGFISFQGLN